MVWNRVRALCLCFTALCLPLPANADSGVLDADPIVPGMGDPDFDYSSTLSIDTDNRETFTFQVRKYVYVLNNEVDASSTHADYPNHCSRLFLGGEDKERGEAWLSLVANNHSEIACKEIKRGNYCSTHPSGHLLGQMVVDQSEIGVLHARLRNDSNAGLFIANCQSGSGVNGRGEEVRVNVMFNGLVKSPAK